MLHYTAATEKYSFTGGWGWLKQVGIRETQISTESKLKLKLSMAEKIFVVQRNGYKSLFRCLMRKHGRRV